MKKIQTLVLAALVAAATFQKALASDPVNPVPGAVCNLYWLDQVGYANEFEGVASTLAAKPAAATFVDASSEFKSSQKKEGIQSRWGMWTGWMKQDRAGTYTFTCQGLDGSFFRYSIWINGQKCATAECGQYSFNVELGAGFNSVKVVSEGDGGRTLSITYKRAGSLKEPVPFGPENMFYEDEE